MFPSAPTTGQRARYVLAGSSVLRSQFGSKCADCVLGWTIEEAAEEAGIPANSVRSRLTAAWAALRKRLAEDPELCELLRGAS